MKKIILLCAMLCSSLNYAASPPHVKVMMTLTNKSNEVLTYTGVTNTNPENVFLVSPTLIMPHSSVMVTSLSNNWNLPDLSADLHFQDTTGNDHPVHVSDPAQLHYASSHLILQDSKNIERVITQSDNPFVITSQASVTSSNA